MGSTTRLRSALGVAAAVAMLGATALPLVAQATGTVRGQVTDATTQRAIGGAQISIVGTARRAVTNSSGEYTLSGVAAGSVTVRAEVIGYSGSSRTVNVTNGATATANFALSQGAVSLDAIVVTGTPGATQKREVGNAISTIAAEQIVDVAPVRTVSELLQARTTGLTLIQPSGTPGTATNIRIRGAGSINAGTRPIFYIDGVRINSGAQGGYSVSGQQTSALDAINPEDIESIEVIKGPAASTLYGADAATGVIQIITKKGRIGEQSIQWTGQVEYGQSEWTADIPDRYTLCTNNRILGRGGNPLPLSGANGAWAGCAGMDTTLSISDQRRVVAGNQLRDDPRALRTGDVRSYTLSARGGGSNYSFYVAGDMDGEEGVFTNSFADRTTGRGNFMVKPREDLDLTLSLSYTSAETRLPNNDNSSWGMLRNTYRARPGRVNAFGEVGYANLTPGIIGDYDNMTRSERVVIGTTSNWQPLSWFRNRLTAGVDINSRRATLFFPIDTTGLAPYGGINATGYIGQYTPRTHQWTLDYAGTASFDVSDDLASETSAGVQFNRAQFRAYEAWGEGLVNNNVNTIGSALVTKSSESIEDQKSMGLFVQQQLGWKNRLFVTGALRADDNSAFGQDFEWIVFPKASLSYVLSDESFFNVPGVDELRLRAAWGRAGNAPAPFSADRNYIAAAQVFQDAQGLVIPVAALRSSSFGNPDLKAETGSELELGFESTMMGGRLGLEFTAYDKTTSDALVPVPVAPSSGFGGTRQINIGDISNRGLEFSVFGQPIASRSVTLDSRLNLSTNQNKLESWGGARDESIQIGYRGTQQHALGKPLGAYYAIAPQTNADGTYVRDFAGRLILSDTSYVGPSVPTREIGFTNTLTLFGNLQLYAFLDYKGGHYQFNMTEATADTDLNSANTFFYGSPGVALGADSLEYRLRTSGATAPYFSKADFLKLRELSATYTVPSRLTRQFGTNNLSLTLAGRNMWMWTKYDGPDPEVNIEGDATFTRVDYMSVPATRRISATVKFTF